MKIKTILKSVTAALIAMSFNVAATDRYFSLTGTDVVGCATGGTVGSPWRSLSTQYDGGCIIPGDTVVVMNGNWLQTDEFFWENNGKIRLSGTEGNRITIRAQNEHAADFVGSFVLSGSYLNIEDIEIRDGELATPVIAIGGAVGLTFDNVYVHDTFTAFVPGSFASREECMKFAGGSDYMGDVVLSNSLIHDCGNTAIDFTQGNGVTVHNNEIYNATMMLFKGGVQDLTVTDNYLHDMDYGIATNTMNCSQDSNPGYCGSWDQLNLPVADRFMVADAVLTGNTLVDISINGADMSGWRRVLLSGNTFTNAPENTLGTIRIRELGTVYYDNQALEYCDDFPTECESCTSGDGRDCVKVVTKTYDIDIQSNTITQSQKMVLTYFTDNMDTPPCWYDNTVNVPTPKFRIDLVESAYDPSLTDCTFRNTLGE